MSEPFLGQISIFGFTFAPRGFARCDGQTLPINQNQSLYSLLGTTYGGDGRTSFNLPDLRGRVPFHFGQGAGLPSYPQGDSDGEETVVLTEAQLAAHTHPVTMTSETATALAPTPTQVLATSTGNGLYHHASGLIPMASAGVTNTGGGSGRQNMMPFLTLNFCIAIQGLFPPRN